MVRPVTFTRFEASDKSLHHTEAEALAHDKRLAQLSVAMADMPPVMDTGCEFTNGGGYKDWPIHVVNMVRGRIMLMLREWAPHLFSGGEPGIQYIGRCLSDFDTYPNLYGVFMRLFFCVDEAGREYGQPYYRNNPDKCGKRAFY